MIMRGERWGIFRMANEATATPQAARLGSIDAYRGLVMILMIGECLHLCRIAAASETGLIWDILCFHQSHVEWRGCSLHDLIQPSFTFLVGVALPFSLASRRRRGHGAIRMTLHAFWRALLLVCLGIFLRSLGSEQTYFTFEDTLTQIGLGYGFLFVLALPKAKWVAWAAIACLLVGYTIAFAVHPVPSSEFDWDEAGVAETWEHNQEGFAAHWNKNTNTAWTFDRWFLNLFPRTSPFQYNSGGYATLSFIPTLATMLLGLIAGRWMLEQRHDLALIVRLCAAGVLLIAAGILLDELNLVPNVKRIWTPTWVLFSGGWCFLMLAGFHTMVDRWKLRPIFFVLIVVGMNSIVAYCMSWLIGSFVQEALIRHLGDELFLQSGELYHSFWLGVGQLLVFWLILFWLYRQRIFVKI